MRQSPGSFWRRPRAVLLLALAVICSYAALQRWSPTPAPTEEATLSDVEPNPKPSSTDPEAQTTEQKTPPTTQLDSNSEFTGVAGEAYLELKNKFAAAAYVAAVEHADLILSKADFDSKFLAWLQSQMSTLLAAAGWQRLKENDCDAATIYLRRAEAAQRSAEVSKGLAYCYHKLKNTLAANEQFQTYLSERSDDKQMRLLYVDHLESDRRYQAAEKVLRAIATATDDEAGRQDLLQRAEAMRAKAREDKNQVSINSEHVQVIYRPEEHTAIVQPILEVLESAISEFEDHLDIEPPRAHLEVILYPAQGFSRFAAGSPDWAQGIFDGRIRLPIPKSALQARGFRELNKVLRHELFHALMANNTGGRPLPPWFNEGMAQRLECPTANPCPVQLPLTPGKFLSEQIFQAPYTSFDALLASRSYNQSRYLIATIEQHYDGIEGLRKIIAELPRSGEIDSDRILRSLNTNFANLRETAAGHWQKKRRIPDRS